MAVQALSDDEITAALKKLAGWSRDGEAITRTYAFPSYLAGVAFTSAVGVVAEGLDHHPDITLAWRKVIVRFTTHDADSKISAKDIDAAHAIESLGYPKA